MWESNFILLGGIALPLFTFLEVIKLVNKHKVNLTQAAVSDADYNNSITSQMVHFEKKKKKRVMAFDNFLVVHQLFFSILYLYSFSLACEFPLYLKAKNQKTASPCWDIYFKKEIHNTVFIFTPALRKILS